MKKLILIFMLLLLVVATSYNQGVKTIKKEKSTADFIGDFNRSLDSLNMLLDESK